LASCGNSVDDEIINFALLFGFHPFIGIERAVGTIAARNLTGDLTRKIGDLERFNTTRATFARDQTRPNMFNTRAQRRDESKSGDNHPSHHHRSKYLPMSASWTRLQCRAEKWIRAGMADPHTSALPRMTEHCVD
jgi:hypothetical protein